MGSYGSGRTGGQPTAEACGSYVFHASWFNRGRLKTGVLGKAPLTYKDGFVVSIAIDTRNPRYWFLTLGHAKRNGDGSRVSYHVQLVQTRPNYGGVRWWFVCPRTGRRVAKLYLPRGGTYFWSRKANRLGYPCQRGSPLERAPHFSAAGGKDPKPMVGRVQGAPSRGSPSRRKVESAYHLGVRQPRLVIESLHISLRGSMKQAHTPTVIRRKCCTYVADLRTLFRHFGSFGDRRLLSPCQLIQTYPLQVTLDHINAHVFLRFGYHLEES